MRQEVLFELRLFFFFFLHILASKTASSTISRIFSKSLHFLHLYYYYYSSYHLNSTLLDYCILTGLSACQILRWLPITLRLILNLFTMVYKSSYRFWPLPLSLSLVIFHCVYPSQVSLSCLYLNIKPNMLPSCFWFW